MIAKATIDGFTDQEVEEAKKGLLQAMQVSRSQDDVVARSWNDKMENQRTWAFSKKQAEAISKLMSALHCVNTSNLMKLLLCWPETRRKRHRRNKNKFKRPKDGSEV